MVFAIGVAVYPLGAPPSLAEIRAEYTRVHAQEFVLSSAVSSLLLWLQEQAWRT